MDAAKRGPRASMREGSGTGGLLLQSGQLVLDRGAFESPAETGADGSASIEHEGGGGLQDVELLSEIGTMGQVDVDVVDALTGVGDLREDAAHPGAARADLGAELHQGRLRAQAVRAEQAGIDRLGRVDGPCAPLSSAEHDTDERRQHDQRADREKSEGHVHDGQR